MASPSHWGRMSEHESNTGRSPHRDYHDYNRESQFNLPDSGIPKVIVPPEPPTFTPAATRALLRLLLAVRDKRTNRTDPSVKETT